jgi:hypothetical protein
MSPTPVVHAETPTTSDSLSIDLIRRKLSSEMVGRHMYLFGRAASTVEILCHLADAGAPESTVVLSEDGIDLRLSVLLRPPRPLQAVGAVASLAGQALTDTMWLERLPVALTVERETAVHRSEWLIVSIDVRLGAVSEAVCCEIDRNALAATFLTLLDRSFATWVAGERGPVVAGGGTAEVAHARSCVAAEQESHDEEHEARLDVAADERRHVTRIIARRPHLAL